MFSRLLVNDIVRVSCGLRDLELRSRLSPNDQRFTKSPRLARPLVTATKVRSVQNEDEGAVVGRFRETASYPTCRVFSSTWVRQKQLHWSNAQG